jgi:hypothetical protein
LKSSLLGLEVESIEEEMLTSDYRNRLDAWRMLGLLLVVIRIFDT